MIKAKAEFILGLDLGQAQDPTALAILKRSPLRAAEGRPARDALGREQHRSVCVHLERWQLGTSYPAIVEKIKTLTSRPELRTGKERPRLAIDATGVGRAVVDVFLAAGLPVQAVPITITPGEGYRKDRWGPGCSLAYWVAKKELVGTIQAGLQTEALKVVPDLGLAETLKAELLNFQVKVTAAANETFNAREGAHDDLVLAVALAAWLGEHPLPVLRFF
jgi:hypothetical protein